MQISNLEDLMQVLVGEHVVAKNIAGNSINLWFVAEPKNERTKRIWIDPPWRIETQAGIESSSYGFPAGKEDGETDAEYRSRFEKSCSQSDCLKGAKLLALTIDQSTSDLTLSFDNGRTLKAFPVDLEYENWHFNDYAMGKRYGVQVTALMLRTMTPNNSFKPTPLRGAA